MNYDVLNQAATAVDSSAARQSRPATTSPVATPDTQESPSVQAATRSTRNASSQAPRGSVDPLHATDRYRLARPLLD